MSVETPLNGVQTTLSEDITDSATSLPLTNAAAFVSGQYAVVLNDGTNTELCLATSLSGSDLTVVRAAESWNGAATSYPFDASVTTVTVVWTQRSVQNFCASLAEVSYTGSNYTRDATALASVDSTNLTFTFTVPYSGNVRLTADMLVGMSSASYYVGFGWFVHGGTTLLSGSHILTYIVGETAPKFPIHFSQLVTGLTPGESIQLDLAWGVSSTSGTATIYPAAITSTTITTTNGMPVHLLAEAA